jgi:hypothetical protein
MADHEEKKCAHPGCVCMARQDSKYCGAYCEGASDTLEVTCNCGHPGCAVHA